VSDIYLADLPQVHPLRNRPLLDIGAATKWKQAEKGWTRVKNSWRIANCCYNDLGSAWTEFSDWRANANENPIVARKRE